MAIIVQILKKLEPTSQKNLMSLKNNDYKITKSRQIIINFIKTIDIA